MCAISYSKQLLTQVLIFDKFRRDFFRSMKKQPTFRDAITCFIAKWRLRNDCRNSILMVCHYPDQGSASDWSFRVVNLLQPIRSITQIWVVTRHQYGISAVLTQMSLRGEISGGVANFLGYYFYFYYFNDNDWKDIDISTVLTLWTSVLVDWFLLVANCDNMKGTLK